MSYGDRCPDHCNAPEQHRELSLDPVNPIQRRIQWAVFIGGVLFVLLFIVGAMAQLAIAGGSP